MKFEMAGGGQIRCAGPITPERPAVRKLSHFCCQVFQPGPILLYNRTLLLAHSRQPLLNQAGEFLLARELDFVYSSVIRTVLWPAIFNASMLDPPTSCRQVILARRKE